MYAQGNRRTLAACAARRRRPLAARRCTLAGRATRRLRFLPGWQLSVHLGAPYATFANPAV